MNSRHENLASSMRQGLAVGCSVMMLTCCLWLQAGYANAQSTLVVTSNLNAQVPAIPDTPIELRLSRDLNANEGRIAIIIDRADVTSLFIVDGPRFVYSPSLVPLPLGESHVIVYLVSDDNGWHEIGRYLLRVVKERPAEPVAPTSVSGPAAGNDPVSATEVNSNGNGGASAPAPKANTQA